MKKLIFTILLFGCVHAVNAQCVATPTDPCVDVHQSLLDRASKVVDELAAAQKAILAFQNERGATDAERAAYKNLAVISDMAMGILQKGIADRDTVIALQQKALDLYSTLVDKLSAKIDAPVSSWHKFLNIVKEVALIALGVSAARLAH